MNKIFTTLAAAAVAICTLLVIGTPQPASATADLPHTYTATINLTPATPITCGTLDYGTLSFRDCPQPNCCNGTGLYCEECDNNYCTCLSLYSPIKVICWNGS